MQTEVVNEWGVDQQRKRGGEWTSSGGDEWGADISDDGWGGRVATVAAMNGVGERR